MERQRANQKTTKAVVARYMKEKKLSSGETTHNIIKELINEGKLKMEVINSQIHFLTVSEKFDFNKMQAEFLKSYVEEAMKPLKLLTPERVNIKIKKRPNSTEYDYSIHVYSGATKNEVDEAVREAMRELRELEEKRMKKTKEPHEKSG